MKRNLPLALALILAAYCAGRLNTRRDGAPILGQNPPPSPAAAKLKTAVGHADAPLAPAQAEAVPAEFEGVDFENFSYPTSLRKRPVRLTVGGDEFYRDETLGSGWLSLKGVDYADVNGDGKKEAVVLVNSVQCGVSCDGGSYLIYFYSMRVHKPALLWRIETGSYGYGCGLKSLVAGKGAVTVEVSNDCRFDGVSLAHRNEPPGGESGRKFGTDNTFTRFRFEFDGRAFALKKREVLPYAREDVKNFEPEIRIGHD